MNDTRNPAVARFLEHDQEQEDCLALAEALTPRITVWDEDQAALDAADVKNALRELGLCLTPR